MEGISMESAVLDANQRLATAGGFLLALGSMVADREACGNNESWTMKKTNRAVSDIECVTSFIMNQQRQIEQLSKDNLRMESTIKEQAAKIEELMGRINEYHAAEQEIPGR